MTSLAAEMTGKGTGAISTIGLVGTDAEGILKKIFTPASKKDFTKIGSITVGTIGDGDEIIDQVVVGCEGEGNFAIHCHGNPLIVEMIMEALGRCGTELTTSRHLLAAGLRAAGNTNTIAVEARLEQIDAKTLAATRLLENQVHAGLSQKAVDWLTEAKKIPISEIRTEAKNILENSQRARLVISGCKAVLLGPPNTGKSTLLNCLTGRQKAIVTDIRGTTRDWVSGELRIEPLYIELIDTAGVDEQAGEAADTAAQQKTMEMVNAADIVLFVLDCGEGAEQIDKKILRNIAGRNVITVLNKCDLPTKLNPDKLPPALANHVKISAKFETNTAALCEKILSACGISDFDLDLPVCFTPRQEALLEKLSAAKTSDDASALITELLNGEVCV